MAAYLPFGAQLKALLETHGVSASQLARTMGFKSKTSLFRILNDEVSYEASARFWKDLCRQNPLSFSAEETHLMEQALDVSLRGQEAFALDDAMSDLLTPAVGSVEDIPLHCYGAAAPQATSFRQLMRIYQKSAKVQFVLMNCNHTGLIRLISESFRSETMTIHHLLDLNGTLKDTVRSISACMPLLSFSNYIPYAIPEPVRGRLIFVLMRTEQDEWETHYFIFDQNGELCMMASRDADFPLFLQSAIQEPMLQHVKPLKDVISSLTGPADYVAYTQRYYELENGRPLYSIKPDVPINFIHPDLLVSAAMDGFNAAGLITPETEALIAALYEVQLKRWQNFFEKRKVTHVIFAKEAMIHFARTGRQTDHFFAMRPYTLKERESILTYLWEQSQSNPYFNIYFAKDNRLIHDREISCYEGMGTVIQDADTSYAHGHQEVILTHEGFARQFKNYFMNELLPRHVLSQRESQHLWDYLLSLCKG